MMEPGGIGYNPAMRNLLSLLACCALLGSLGLAQARTQVIMLGSGSPNADPDRSGPAVAVVVNGTAYLVDCGPGVVRRAAAAARDGHPALRVIRITHVFITHLHSDHTLGYPDLILSPWVLGRKVPLEAYGPVGLQDMTTYILKAWSKDIAVRTTGLEHANTTGDHVVVHEIQPGVVYHDANVTVTAFLVHHGSWDEALGYRFQTADRSIVFSGDTSPVPAVAASCHGCDLLFHEVYNPSDASTPAWAAYLAAFHTSAAQLDQVARAAHPKLLVLYHELFGGRSEADLLKLVRQGYSGPVVSAHDLEVF